MTRIFLTRASEEALSQYSDLPALFSHAIVITTNANGNKLVACSVLKTTLFSLKTVYLDKVFKNIEVYTFGLEDFRPDQQIELTFIPLSRLPFVQDKQLTPAEDILYVRLLAEEEMIPPALEQVS